MSAHKIQSIRVIPIGTTPKTAQECTEYPGPWGDEPLAAVARWRRRYGSSWEVHRVWLRQRHLFVSLRPRKLRSHRINLVFAQRRAVHSEAA